MRSESIKELASALAKVKFGEIGKSKTVKVQTKSGSSYNFEYAPLEVIMAAIRGPLAEQGLTLSQTISQGPPLGVYTTLLHSSGEWIDSFCPVVSKEGCTAQEMGSAITYARRYGVTLICCLVADEDDDGNIADGNTVQKTREVAKTIDQEVAFENIEPTLLAEIRREAKAIEGDFLTLGTKHAVTRYEAFKKIAGEGEIEALWAFLDSKVRNGMKRFQQGVTA